MRYQNAKKKFTRLIKYSVFMLNDDFPIEILPDGSVMIICVHMTAVELRVCTVCVHGALSPFVGKQPPFLYYSFNFSAVCTRYCQHLKDQKYDKRISTCLPICFESDFKKVSRFF